MIVTLTEQLQKMSTVNYNAIKKFLNDFLAGFRQEKPRKEREGGSNRKPRRRPADKTRGTKGINGMAE